MNLHNYVTSDFSETNNAYLRLVSLPLELKQYDDYIHVILNFARNEQVNIGALTVHFENWLQRIKDLAELELPDNNDIIGNQLKVEAIVSYIVCVAEYTKLLDSLARPIDPYWSAPIPDLVRYQLSSANRQQDIA
jgi:hypothetical protein